jgi:hypothetical protein
MAASLIQTFQNGELASKGLVTNPPVVAFSSKCVSSYAPTQCFEIHQTYSLSHVCLTTASS